MLAHGRNNYIPRRGRSEFTVPNPQQLPNQSAGHGLQIGQVPVGQPGLKERVDFRKESGQ